MKYLWIIALYLFAVPTFAQMDMKMMIDEIKILEEEGKFEEALELVEKGYAETGNTILLRLKRGILSAAGRHDEALEVALKREELTDKESPMSKNVCLDIVRVYLDLKNSDQALDWLEEAVNRGFIRYQWFTNARYDLIRDNERFHALERRAKEIVGIGKPPKDFTVDLLSGDSFTLSEQKGRVVLVDFWATWCVPCCAEIPHLKKMYDAYREKGFEIIGISLDQEKEKLLKYINDETLDWKISYSGEYLEDPTAKLYSVNELPSRWLVDKEGILKAFDLSGEELEKAIEDLI